MKITPQPQLSDLLVALVGLALIALAMIIAFVVTMIVGSYWAAIIAAPLTIIVLEGWRRWAW